jgi:predicted outer membrane repeat protein
MPRRIKRLAVTSIGAALLSAAAGASAQSVRFVNAAASPGGDGLSWSTAFIDLQDALTAVSPPGVNEIWVAQGTYTPDHGTGNPAVAFAVPSGVRLLGGFAGGESSRAQRNWATHPTILSGELASGNRYHVLTAASASSDTLIDGFVIAGGRAVGAGPHGQGGGIRLESSSMQISYCTFRNNQAGTGAAIASYGGSPLIFNCQINGNLSTGTIAGAYFTGGFSDEIHPRMINCTVARNTATVRSGPTAVFCAPWIGELTMRNCIVYDNLFTIETWYPSQSGGALDIAYCLQNESGGWPPNPSNPPPNALRSNPLFVDAAGPDGTPGTADDDLRIRAGSPAIDSGDPSAVPADTFDLDDDGNTAEPTPLDLGLTPRVYDDPATTNTGAGGGYIDMGAAEGPAFAVSVSTPGISIPEGSSLNISVALTRAPTSGNATVSLATTGDPDFFPDPASLSFDANNWATPQTVAVHAPEDADSFAGSAVLTLTSPAALTGRVELTEIENDAPPGLIYVRAGATGAGNGSTWADAFPSVTAGLAYAAGSGGSVTQVWVAQGTYKPAGAGINSTFALQNNLALYGGFAGTETGFNQRDVAAHPTILSGDLAGDDGPDFANRDENTTHVVTGNGRDPTAILDGFTITGGSARDQQANSGQFGGGMVVLLGRPTIRNCTFTGNQSDRNGGAVYQSQGNDGGASFENCSFLANRTIQQRGGAYYTPGTGNQGNMTPIHFVDCLFQGNTTYEQGGALWIQGGINAENCTFQANLVPWVSGQPVPDAGSVFLDVSRCSSTFTNCSFTDNALRTDVGQSHGGGLYVVGNGAVTLSGCSFSGNTATYGGGIYMAGSPTITPLIEDCTFDHNTAANRGGGIYAVGGLASGIADHCTFTQNDAGANGGCEFQGSVLSGLFVENTARNGGGGSGTFNYNSVYSGNIADTPGTPPDESIRGGGAVFNVGSLFDGCVFTDNHATGLYGSGGAVALLGSTTRFVRCQFVGNSANSRGGAIAGGGHLINCVVAGNTAGESAGGAYGLTQATNCIITGNSAANNAGGLWLRGLNNFTPVLVTNCTIYGNSAATAGGVLVDRYTVRLQNSVLWGNTQTSSGTTEQAQFGQIIQYEPRRESFFSNIEGWSGAIAGSGNSGANPLFADPLGPDEIPGTADDDLRIATNSPCVDSGDNSLIPPDAGDLDGDNNDTEPVPFDFALDLRRRDVPETLDTGTGEAPIVDRGAIEAVPIEHLTSPCYPNCDGSTVPPILNVLDFNCFLNRFSAADPYANCDGSTVPPMLNVLDFNCFLNRFSLGCR